jgi:hypothetical protein
MTYSVRIFNGNVGEETAYETYEEARRAADDAWYHLTPRERRATTDRERGAFFYISEDDENGEEITSVYDFADLLNDEEYEIGDTPRESYDWDSEWDCSTRSTTGETIGGTCAVCIADTEDIGSIERAMNGAGLYAGPGGRMALIHADLGEYGNDPDEIILQGGMFDAVEVVAVWEVE